MAISNAIPAKRETIERIVEPARIELSLSVKEAELIHFVVGSCQSNPEVSSIYAALGSSLSALGKQPGWQTLRWSESTGVLRVVPKN